MTIVGRCKMVTRRTKQGVIFLPALFFLALMCCFIPARLAAKNKSMPSADPIAIEKTAWAYLTNGQPNKCIDFLLDQSTETVNNQTLLALGWSYFLNQKYEQAKITLNQCVRSRHLATSAHVLLGRICAALGNFEEAHQEYKQAKKLDYSLSETDFGRAQLFEKQKELNASWGFYSRLVQVDPKWAEVKNKRDALRPLITKKPEEIVRANKISSPSKVELPFTVSGPLLMIGLHTDSKGTQIPISNTIFRAGSTFVIKEKISGKVLSKGSALEEWILKAGKNKIQLSCPTKKIKVDSTDSIYIQMESTGTTIVLQDMLHAKGYAWARVQDQEYRGMIEVSLRNNGLVFANRIHLEDYLLSVLPSEMIAWWPLEALKCQAVISRTNALYKAQVELLHKKDQFDLCDSQHCQVYVGANTETSKARKAVESTLGKALYYKGKIAHALFSSNCGGKTQSSGDLYGWGQEPYLLETPDTMPNQEFPNSPEEFDRWLKEVPKTYCSPSKETYFSESRWIRIIPQKIISERVQRTKQIGKVTAIRALSRNPSGHVRKLEIEGEGGNLIVEKEHVMRNILAPGLLRSTLFLVGFVPDLKGSGDFIFWGGGWGHGVGLCQSGVAGRVVAGQRYTEILQHYYTGISVSQLN